MPCSASTNVKRLQRAAAIRVSCRHAPETHGTDRSARAVRHSPARRVQRRGAVRAACRHAPHTQLAQAAGQAWGGFAAVTNRARDWDVFLLTAQDVLAADELGRFATENRELVQFCHDAVIELLLSAPWRRHLGEWRQYLERTHDHADDEFIAKQSLADALANARAALAAAQLAGDERAWHKLRIALKEVRYQAESGPGGAPVDEEAAALVEQCKPLQSLLGGWHDCVVQLQLLDELEPAPEHECLRECIEKKRVDELAEIQRTLAGHPLFEE
jgi:CHAD domain-containing protein